MSGASAARAALDELLAPVAAAFRAFEGALATGRSVGPGRAVELDAKRALALARDAGLEPLYAPRIDELARELEIVRADPARRFASSLARYAPREPALGARVHALATAWLAEGGERGADAEDAPAEDALGRLARCARLLDLPVTIRLAPGLVANAAAGDATLYLRSSDLGERALARTAVHELLGHLAAAHGALRAPIGLLRFGAAGAFEDQEGLALTLERDARLLDAGRRRVLAARTLATLHRAEGATSAERRRALLDGGATPAEAHAAAVRSERATARDLAYLVGLIRVGDALARGEVDRDELRLGRVSVSAANMLRPSPERPNPRAWPHASAVAAALLSDRASRRDETPRSPARASSRRHRAERLP